MVDYLLNLEVSMKQVVFYFGILLMGVLMLTSGCTKQEKTVGGALVGAAAGAGIGSIAGGTGGGIAGGITGGILGGVIGRSMGNDRK